MLRELLYPWHPWFALQVSIHAAIEKFDGVVFRCTVSGSDLDRWLEVPAWMFERAACRGHSQLTSPPHIDVTALSALADLLRQVWKDRAISSNAPFSGASESSHDQNRRGAHVSIDVSAALSQHEGTPKAACRNSGRKTAADRSIRRRAGERFDGGPEMARTPGGDAGHADQHDCAVDSGACSGKPDQIIDGGRS
jgi:hypothetical protein